MSKRVCTLTCASYANDEMLARARGSLMFARWSYEESQLTGTTTQKIIDRLRSAEGWLAVVKRDIAACERSRKG
jgi:hypothetical protein